MMHRPLIDRGFDRGRVTRPSPPLSPSPVYRSRIKVTEIGRARGAVSGPRHFHIVMSRILSGPGRYYALTNHLGQVLNCV